jgi:hypothetical protein
MSEAPPPVSTTKDRSTALTLVGSLLVAIGVLWALLIPLRFLAFLPAIRRQVELTQGRPLDPSGVITGAGLLAIVAALFLWIGIGAIRKRRWVRPIMLIASWSSLVAGVIAGIMMLFILPPVLRATLAKTPGSSPQMGLIVGTVIAAFFTVFYVVIPLSLALFFRSPHVRATLEARDPIPGWTDACPISVLVLCLFLGVGACGLLYTAKLGVFPVFSVLVTGPSAVVLASLLAALYGYFALAAYRLQPIGWWGPLVVLPVQTLSTSIYFIQGDLTAYLAAIGVQGDQSRMVLDTGLFSGSFMAGNCLFWLAVNVGYILWVRKYFVTPAALAEP